MAVAVATKLWTIEDFDAMEEDGARYELLRGELIEMPGGKFEHGFLVARLLTWLSAFVDRHELGAVINNCAFVISRDPDSLLIPDVAFVSTARMPPDDEDWAIYLGAPDAAFEVVSPSDTAPVVHEKILTFLDGGVRVVVAVWPRSRSVTVHRQGTGEREYNW